MNREAYESLLADDTLLSQPDTNAIKVIGELIDYSGDEALPEGCRKAIEVSEALLQRRLAPEDRTVLEYFVANAWASLYVLRDTEAKWAWDQPELASEILHLRTALLGPGFGLVSSQRRCEILTNLGNLMSHVGRFVDALPYWRRAEAIDHSFGMAIGNLGMGLFTYARCLHDQGHAGLFVRRSYEELTRAVGLPLHSAAREAFERQRTYIRAGAAKGVLDSITDWDGFPLGRTPVERQYRTWCLENVLFVNPLNDIGSRPIAARDVLTAPAIAVTIGEGPYYAALHDQMKQEYASARFLFWEGMTQGGLHFSDQGVRLHNTLDSPVYGLFAEKVRMSFRMAYSLLDKVAFFLNHYFHLGCSANRVYFRTIWYSAQRRENGVLPALEATRNLPLRGLFWLSQDLFSDEPGFRDSIEPEGRDVDAIRQHLEHKYLKLHADGWQRPADPIGFVDPLAYSLNLGDLEQKTLQLLRMVRSALIYLALGVHVEESQRRRKRPRKGVVPGIELIEWDDGRKEHP